MDKRKHNKGFTVIEIIFVLSILTVSMLLLMVNKKPSTLHLQMRTIQSKIIDLQLTAISKKEKQKIVFQTSSIELNDSSLPLLNNMVCDTATVTFNALGNINHADTVCCYQAQQKLCIKFQLGAGRCSIE